MIITKKNMFKENLLLKNTLESSPKTPESTPESQKSSDERIKDLERFSLERQENAEKILSGVDELIKNAGKPKTDNPELARIRAEIEKIKEEALSLSSPETIALATRALENTVFLTNQGSKLESDDSQNNIRVDSSLPTIKDLPASPQRPAPLVGNISIDTSLPKREPVKLETKEFPK